MIKEMTTHELNVLPTISQTSSIPPRKHMTGAQNEDQMDMEKVCVVEAGFLRLWTLIGGFRTGKPERGSGTKFTFR